MTSDSDEHQLRPLRIENDDQEVLGRGVEFPSGKVQIEWDLDAWDGGDGLEESPQAMFGSIPDAEAGSGGHVVVEPDRDPTLPDDGDDGDEEPEPEPEPVETHTLTITSTARTPAMQYSFTVDGTVEPHSNLEDTDKITEDDDTTIVEGAVGPKGSDAYQVTGPITSWETWHADTDLRVSEDRYDVRLDDDPIVVREFFELPEPEPREHVLELTSNPSTPATTYRFSVEGDVTAEASLEDHDQIETDDGTTTVTGLFGPQGRDVYRVTGRPIEWTTLDDSRRFVAEHRYSLVVDGDEVTLDQLLEGGRRTRRVEIVAPGELDYTLEADGRIEKVRDDESDWSAERDNDSVTETDDGTWRASGATGNGYGDAYEVQGRLLDFQASTDSYAVYVDGVQVEPSSIGSASGLKETATEMGGGHGYDRAVKPEKADVTVSTLKGVGDALDDASAGDIVYVAGNAHIDMGSSELTVPAGVTLASNRGIGGAPGARLSTDRETDQIHLEKGGRVTGLRIQGKYYEYFDPRGDDAYPTGTGVRVTGRNAEVDNCEIWGHAYAAINAGNNAPHIHHNHLHHTPRAGLGYGIVMSDGHPIIEWNYFNYNRHAIAGSGGGGYTARYNHVGPETIGHIFDMHKPGGDRIHVHNNTVEGYRMLQSSRGKYTAAVMVRGTPSDVCLIEDNWFYNDKPPRDRPTSGFTNEAIVQVHRTTWKNMEWSGNHLGQDEPSDSGVGAPELWDGN